MQFRRPFFDPPPVLQVAGASGEPHLGDPGAGDVYVFSDDIVLAVNAALATSRPLLVTGPPGSGKSTLARAVAHVLPRRLYTRVVGSTTQAQDLLWTYDAVRRLNDGAIARPREAYVDPGVLWWALDPESAARRGASTTTQMAATDPGVGEGDGGAVVLLDEIDKADPDVPNDLLVPLGNGWFEVHETDYLVTAKRKVLLVITSNGERDLAPAFVRRCVALELPVPAPDWMVRVADAHFGASPMHARLAKLMEDFVETARARRGRSPGTAEYLDTIKACRDLLPPAGDEATWNEALAAIMKITLVKPGASTSSP